MVIKQLKQIHATPQTYNATPLWIPTSPWQFAVGVSKVDFAVRVRNLVTGFGVKPGMQLAEVLTDSPAPGAPITDGGYLSANGPVHFQESGSDK